MACLSKVGSDGRAVGVIMVRYGRSQSLEEPEQEPIEADQREAWIVKDCNARGVTRSCEEEN